MPVTDPISDMLTRIRNAVMVRHDTVSIPKSSTKAAIAQILKEEGFIETFDINDEASAQGAIVVKLHYGEENDSAITGLKRVSRPGLRVYVKKGEIPRYYGGLGVPILSTPRGLMTGNKARREGVGGELMCYVW
mgnify:CR=1 FL=1